MSNGGVVVSHVKKPLYGLTAGPPDIVRSTLPEKYRVRGAACAVEAAPTRTKTPTHRVRINAIAVSLGRSRTVRKRPATSCMNHSSRDIRKKAWSPIVDGCRSQRQGREQSSGLVLPEHPLNLGWVLRLGEREHQEDARLDGLQIVAADAARRATPAAAGHAAAAGARRRDDEDAFVGGVGNSFALRATRRARARAGNDDALGAGVRGRLDQVTGRPLIGEDHVDPRQLLNRPDVELAVGGVPAHRLPENHHAIEDPAEDAVVA